MALERSNFITLKAIAILTGTVGRAEQDEPTGLISVQKLVFSSELVQPFDGLAKILTYQCFQAVNWLWFQQLVRLKPAETPDFSCCATFGISPARSPATQLFLE